MLSPFGRLYGIIADARNTLYDQGIFKSRPLGAKTISIGNITAGGTGKTPLVAFVAEILAEKGETVCILTRGYGRKDPKNRVLVSDGKSVLADAESGGDEPVELARKLLGKAIVVADADRVSAARWAKEKFGVTAFVLDDGFQHRRAKRDLDIICVDATNPFGNGKMLPAGSLRESLKHLERADIIVITRTDLVESTDEIISVLLGHNKDLKIFGASNKVCDISKLDDFLDGRITPGDDEDRQFIAGAYLFCGIGNPKNLTAQLKQENFGISGMKQFADHHFYTQHDIWLIEAAARQNGSHALLTTGKDAVKLAKLSFKMPCFVVLSDSKINDEKSFKDLVNAF